MSAVEFERPKGFEYHQPTIRKATQTFMIGLLLRTGWVKTREQATYIFIGVILMSVLSTTYILLNIEGKKVGSLTDPETQAYIEILSRTTN